MIREMRKKWFIFILIRKVPHRLCKYRIKWMVDIMQRTSGSAGSIHYRTSLEEVTSETFDISKYIGFEFYF